MKPINVLGRILVVQENHILLVRKKGQDWCFLPGGHVEHGEGVKQTIMRECLEEFGGKVEISDFLGVAEHAFEAKTGLYHEINLVFKGVLQEFKYPDLPKALEDDLEVLWCSLEKLKECNVLPEMMREVIEKGQRDFWLSDMN